MVLLIASADRRVKTKKIRHYAADDDDDVMRQI